MKIQFLNGGLANQVFQYIFAKYYELTYPGEIMYLDDTYFALNTVHNGYELEKVFGLKPHMLSSCFDEEVWSFILEERRRGKSVPTILCENGIEICMISEVGEAHKKFNPFEGKVVFAPTNAYTPLILLAEGDIYYHGYWLNKSWFQAYKDSFLRELAFPEIRDEVNRERLKIITETKSLSIHIRRGDYVDLNLAYGLDNYRTMIECFTEARGCDWELFVFSDDIDWCRKNQNAMGFGRLKGLHFIDGNINGKNYIDMQLMSRCEAMIVGNSSFCYLAALLNTRKQCAYNFSEREL